MLNDRSSPLASSPNPDLAPIFIIGSGRSGTSLLRAMLNAHPRIYLLQEASFYTWTEMPPPWVNAERRLEFYFRSFSFAWLGINPHHVRAAFPPPIPRERLSDVSRFIMRELAARRGKPRYGEKNPTNTVYVERIFEGFPDARVVRMVRDPRSMVASHARMPFSSPSIFLWALLFRRARQKLAPFLDRILNVRMEDLTADPRATMEKVLAFVGEPWDEAVLDHPRHLIPDDGPPFPWVRDGYSRPEVRPPSWPRHLSPAQVRLVEWLNRDWMQRHGYAPAELGREPAVGEILGTSVADIVAAAAYLARALRSARRLSRRPYPDATETQRLFLGLNPAAWKHHPDWSLSDPPPFPQEVIGANDRTHTVESADSRPPHD